MDRYMGYTIIELVVVLTLFSIILMIAVPNLGIIREFKEYQQIRQLKSDILFARNQAIVKGKIHIVQFDFVRNGYIIVVGGGTIKRVYFDDGIELIKNMEMTEVSFYRTGVPGKSGTIRLKNSKNKTYEVVVTPVVGKVNIKK
ncbi:GspH/FimT family protein [Tissierella sp. Yu-01]|uniref:GspH/FimT family pseudopilin n=1 Tax=Tissierella sp. Yu-01 TaxID=3035694 RepID=UPI00240CECDF|nr:GspH/FimT family protein [Tissierella sp. Yu-01]WFA09681.1 GspH/FimT family protein [Tissierella sp. Yu-01]